MNSTSSKKTIDQQEIARFALIASEWWDPNGKFRPLHQLGPVRLSYIRDQVCMHYVREKRSPKCLEGLKFLDIGCGGGLISEPVTRMGAKVKGIDPAPENVAAARQHANEQSLEIDYQVLKIEDLAQDGQTFDVVLCLEVLEHVPNVPAFIEICAGLVKPGGMMILSTLNRTLKSFALAIVGAEYILRWLPVGTHQWERFVAPGELKSALKAAHLETTDITGVVYNLLSDIWRLSDDTDVNYFATAIRPEG